MLSPDQWTDKIIAYMEKNRVSTLEQARGQIRTIVKWIQDDVAPQDNNFPKDAA